MTYRNIQGVLMRTAEINRVTNETDVNLWLDLDGDGKESEIKTGIGFFDHMMTLFSRHSGIQMSLTCEGDTWVDDHHSVEDIGITLGEAIKEALKGVSYDGVTGAISFNAEGDANKDMAFIKTVKDGKFQFLTTTTISG